VGTQEGLPVQRHVHRALASVYALNSEVAAWRHSHALGPAGRAPVTDTAMGSALSIAVLPFVNLSVDPENAYFADGLAEEVTTILSQVHALLVTSRTSSTTFRDTKKGAKAIAAQLGVRYLLEGSVRRDVHRLRISVQLIDAAKDIHLWADAYDGTIDEIFAIQERIARKIVDSLRLHLSVHEEKQLGEPSMTNVAAYECYLRARHDGWRWRQDSIERAVQLLREAVSMIGANIRLYAALGLAHLQYREAGIDLSERPLLEAENCARKLRESHVENLEVLCSKLRPRVVPGVCRGRCSSHRYPKVIIFPEVLYQMIPFCTTRPRSVVAVLGSPLERRAKSADDRFMSSQTRNLAKPQCRSHK
jgi:TolB-like protein